MITLDYSGKTVLITGGTKGIGLATGLAFGAGGAKIVMTHKWGTADEDAIRARFKEVGAPDPVIECADVSQADDTKALMETLKGSHGITAVDEFVSNAAFALVVKGLDSYKKKSLFKTLEYSTWPLIDYTRRIHKTFGAYPRYVVAVSSDGPDSFYQGYDFVAASKALMELFVRYMTAHLKDEEININVLRARSVKTESLEATFGPDFVPFLQKYGGKKVLITVEECANAILAMCSGLLDAMNGQILFLDYAERIRDTLMNLYTDRDRLGL